MFQRQQSKCEEGSGLIVSIDEPGHGDSEVYERWGPHSKPNGWQDKALQEFHRC